MVRKRQLLLLASVVWLLAGGNILKIGLAAYTAYFSVINILLSIVVFSVFWHFVFSKLVKKHTHRIMSFQNEKQYFWRFFDKKSFLLMTFMMTGGILLRQWQLVPISFIAVFYSGLGLALFIAGASFGVAFVTVKEA